jgi:hypothetical protein
MIRKTQRAQRDHKVSTKTTLFSAIPTILGGSRTGCNCKLDYHDSCILCKGSTLHPRVVISSMAERQVKPPFCHSYTSFGVWPRDHYMPLQRFTTGVCHALLQFPKQMVPACSAKVSRTNDPSWTLWFRQITKYATCMTQRMMPILTQPSKTHNL